MRDHCIHNNFNFKGLLIGLKSKKACRGNCRKDVPDAHTKKSSNRVVSSQEP